MGIEQKREDDTLLVKGENTPANTQMFADKGLDVVGQAHYFPSI
jgi:hypothetical protein